MNIQDKIFRFYFHFVGWDCISLGLHFCLSAPNIEFHLPFGFIRIGWEPYWAKRAALSEEIGFRKVGES